MSVSSGYALMRDRERQYDGYIAWGSPGELRDTDTLAARIEWDPAKWPEGVRASFLSVGWTVTPGKLLTVGYKGTGPSDKVRFYTFVMCAREGCPHRVMVDLENPDFKPKDGYTVGVHGGGEVDPPAWWGKRTFLCEEGLSTTAPFPCKLVRSEALAQFEQASPDTRWTMWTVHASQGTVLFYDRRAKAFGLLDYDETTFTTLGRIAQGIRWVPLAGLESTLKDKDHCHEILSEVRQAVHAPS